MPSSFFSLFKRRSVSLLPEAHRTGAWGERAAARFLKEKGYLILGRNIRFGSRAELDVVARQEHPPVLVFVEVKTRRGEEFGRPFSAVNRNKRRVIGRAAMHYLRRMKERPKHIRFDVVEIIGSPGVDAPIIRHIENAFSPGPEYRLPW
ncbi:MAG: YraN family protein [Verrucomicrobiota bacterium]|jgi:putative endonuclease|nr:YraN family protein [Verrucomicrobiota bacterium]